MLVENNSSFDDESDGNGGGISVGNGSLSIQNSAVLFNSAGTRGGGISSFLIIRGTHPASS